MKRTISAILALAVIACSTAADRAAEQERSRAIQEIADRKVEYGELSEIAAARSICFLAQPDSQILADFTRAVSERRPPNMSISYGIVARDCADAELFVAFDAGRGIIFSLRGDKMRMLGEKRAESALAFARQFLMTINDETP